MSHSQESHYMEGIRVKISEKYKPPRRINLAMSYVQRLSLNKQLQENLPDYDFSLETSLKEKMSQWTVARKMLIEEQNKRSERIKEEQTKFNEKLERELKEKSEQCNNQCENSVITTYNSNSQLLIPMPVTSVSYSNMQTATSVVNSVSYDTRNSFNISDFENDTSSPFDNMELKSINDMEELAQVLQKDENKVIAPYSVPQTYSSYAPVQNISTHSYTSYHNPQYVSYHPCLSNTTLTSASQAQCYVPVTYRNDDYYPQYVTYNETVPLERRQNQDAKFKIVPDIMKALKEELDNTHIINASADFKTDKPIYVNNFKFNSNLGSNSIELNKCAQLENPYNLLPQDLQSLTDNISSMGFPSARVARACKALGNDHKTVVDYLLTMSELLDLGFNENDVSSALHQTNNDKDKALDILIS